MTQALSLFSTRAAFVNPDGTLTKEAAKALSVVFQRVGGAEQESLYQVFAPFLTPSECAPEVMQPPIPAEEVSGVLQALPPADEFTPMVFQVIARNALVEKFLNNPTSANLAAAITDETGTGVLVFGTNATITNLRVATTLYEDEPVHVTYAGAATLAAADMITTKKIRWTGAAATLTFPTGTDIDLGVATQLGLDKGFKFSVMNEGTGTVTLGTAAGLTLRGGMTVATGASGYFTARRSAANAYVIYRIA